MLRRSASPSPDGLVLVLPGGRPQSTAAAHWWQLAPLRMRALTAALQARLGGRAVVRQLNYQYRGWNGPRRDPLQDGQRVLEQLHRDYGALPVALVGHSMGGRAAAHLAAWPHVRAVAALAPWWPAADSAEIPPHVRLLVVHGLADRRTSPAESHQQVLQARARGADAEWVGIPGAGHAMLRHFARWQRTTEDFVAGELSGAAR